MARIRHVEFAGKDGARLRSFYAELFGWEISAREVGGLDYYDVDLPGDLSAGIRDEPGGTAEVVVYVEVEDLGGTVERATSRGATVRIPPTEHDDLRFALIEDPSANPVGLIQA